MQYINNRTTQRSRISKAPFPLNSGKAWKGTLSCQLCQKIAVDTGQHYLLLNQILRSV